MSTFETYKPALIKLGTHKVAHLDETLLDHLQHTYRILKDMGCAEHICLAGLFHGVYGTQALHAERIEALPEGQREELKQLIGEDGEQLLYTFSILSYDSLGRSLRNVLRPDGQPDLRDRITGEPIPLTHEAFDELLWLKLGDVLAHVPVQKTHSQLDLPAEHASFWEIVAEHLGTRAEEAWSNIVGTPA